MTISRNDGAGRWTAGHRNGSRRLKPLTPRSPWSSVVLCGMEFQEIADHWLPKYLHRDWRKARAFC